MDNALAVEGNAERMMREAREEEARQENLRLAAVWGDSVMWYRRQKASGNTSLFWNHWASKDHTAPCCLNAQCRFPAPNRPDFQDVRFLNVMGDDDTTMRFQVAGCKSSSSIVCMRILMRCRIGSSTF